MRRPVVGVIGSAYRIEDRFATQLVGERNLRAVAEVAGALPLMFAAAPDITDIGALLDAVDGIVLTGARANVHPARFGTEPDSRHEPFDLHRDDVALALSEACVARGIPLFGICRGLQEMNVAFGGSLHPEDRKSTRLNSSHLVISYAVFCLKTKQYRHGATSKRRSNTASNSTKHKSPHLSGWRPIISLIT